MTLEPADWPGLRKGRCLFSLMRDTIHWGRSCKDMRRLDPHFELLTTQDSAVKTLNHWSWAMVSRPNLNDIDTTKFALCLVEFSQILSKGYYRQIYASHLSNTQHHHWMPPTATEAFVTHKPSSFPPLPLHHFLKIFPPCLTSLVLGLPCLWNVVSIWKALGAHRLQGRTSSPLLIRQPVQSYSNKSLPFL